ncbi:MAG: MFS transporter [Chloroflexota bacterium]|nr:MFS transporter [Chloroflexota bacterium]
MGRVPFLPPETSQDARVLLTARGLRAFGDGFVSILLPVHLAQLGLSNFQIGAVATSTLLGSAALTLLVGFNAHRIGRRALLFRASVLMFITGLGFAFLRDFWPLLLIAFLGTINPSSGDVSVFLPTELALLPQTTSEAQRTALFARFSMIGSLVAAFGALCAGGPSWLAAQQGIPLELGIDVMFVLYALLGVVALFLYRGLSPAVEPDIKKPPTPLGPSKRTVYNLSALFSLDSFGSGLVVQSLLALWLFQRFGFAVTTTGLIFFWTGIFSALSALLAVRISRKIGLINTAVFTHLPANACLMLAPFMPTVELSVLLLLVRSLFSQMDVPVRNSYVMAVVTPPERPAAASITAVPKSLASALGPLLSGWLFSLSVFGWPLVIAGGLKGLYDVMLLLRFRALKPPEEQELPSGRQRST